MVVVGSSLLAVGNGGGFQGFPYPMELLEGL